ncbi:MAG: hypothetical protein OEM63_15920, partial [Gammaproteobacteria bacterium]|nr:hypothetical protein [Gammaproteobacteria bacterium]
MFVVASLIIVKMTGTVELTIFDSVGQPISAAIVICVVGIGSLYLLHQNFSLVVFGADSFRRGLPVAIALAIPFMIGV